MTENRLAISPTEIADLRLRVVGRLTTSLFHEINNPMQAVLAALVLAQEELDDARAVRAYIDLCLNESKRVTQLIQRARSIYRSESVTAADLDLAPVVADVVTLLAGEMKRQQVSVTCHVAPGLPSLTGVKNHVELMLITLLLDISAFAGERGGGSLSLHVYHLDPHVCLAFSCQPHLQSLGAAVEFALGERLVRSQNGQIRQNSSAESLNVTVSLPCLTM